MDLEGVMLSEISETEKDKNSTISLICEIFLKNEPTKQIKNKPIDMDNRLVVTRWKGDVGKAKWIKEIKRMVMDGK